MMMHDIFVTCKLTDQTLFAKSASFSFSHGRGEINDTVCVCGVCFFRFFSHTRGETDDTLQKLAKRTSCAPSFMDKGGTGRRCRSATTTPRCSQSVFWLPQVLRRGRKGGIFVMGRQNKLTLFAKCASAASIFETRKEE